MQIIIHSYEITRIREEKEEVDDDDDDDGSRHQHSPLRNSI